MRSRNLKASEPQKYLGSDKGSILAERTTEAKVLGRVGCVLG